MAQVVLAYPEINENDYLIIQNYQKKMMNCIILLLSHILH